MSAVIELRVYTLKAGTRSEFQRRFAEEIGPMLERFGIRVVEARPSLHDEQSFTLIRSFPSVAEREEQLARFYGSEEWLTHHDQAVMGMIEQYDTCVLDAAELAERVLELPGAGNG